MILWLVEFWRFLEEAEDNVVSTPVILASGKNMICQFVSRLGPCLLSFFLVTRAVSSCGLKKRCQCVAGTGGRHSDAGILPWFCYRVYVYAILSSAPRFKSSCFAPLSQLWVSVQHSTISLVFLCHFFSFLVLPMNPGLRVQIPALLL